MSPRRLALLGCVLALEQARARVLEGLERARLRRRRGSAVVALEALHALGDLLALTTQAPVVVHAWVAQGLIDQSAGLVEQGQGRRPVAVVDLVGLGGVQDRLGPAVQGLARDPVHAGVALLHLLLAG